MLDSPKHNCAVVAIKANKPTEIGSKITRLIYELRNRGEDEFGMVVHGMDRPDHHFNLIKQSPSEKVDAELLATSPDRIAVGTLGIGHAKYQTSGVGHVQPQRVEDFGYLGFNGHISNFNELKQRFSPQPHLDTDVIRLMLEEALQEQTDHPQAIARVMKELQSAYSIVLSTDDGNLLAFRDHQEMRPLKRARITGPENTIYDVVLSEDAPLNCQRTFAEVFPDSRLRFIEDLKGGEIHEISNQDRSVSLPVIDRNPKHCFFEWVYFAQVLSELEGLKVRNLRDHLGKILAQYDAGEPESQLVMPVPNSAITSALSYLQERRNRWGHSELEYEERILIRHLTDRSFTKGERLREQVAQEKLEIAPGRGYQLANQDIVLVDDSMVRSTTMKTVIEKLRQNQPRSIHLRLACPPIVALCYFGIDMSNLDQQIARKYFNGDGSFKENWLDELAQEIGVDSIKFLSLSDMKRAFATCGIDPADLCTACVTGTVESYPTDGARKQFSQALEDEAN